MESSQESSDPLELGKHGRALRSLAQSILRDEHAANDAVQDAYLDVVQKGNGDASSLVQRLRGLVSRHARDKRRAEFARRVREERHAHDRASEDASVDRSFASAEIVTHALAALPKDSRNVLWLRYYEDLGPKAISERLELPLETVRARLRRALAALRVDVEARLRVQGRSLQALLPLASLEFAGTAATPAVTAAGYAAGGILAMKKLMLIVVALTAGWLLIERARNSEDVSVAHSEPIASAPSYGGQTAEVEFRSASVLQVVEKETPRSVATPEDSSSRAVSPAKELVPLRVVVRDLSAAQAVPFFPVTASVPGASHGLRTDEKGMFTLQIPEGDWVTFTWSDDAVEQREAALRRETPRLAPTIRLAPEIGLGGDSAGVTGSIWWENDGSGEVDLTVVVGPTWLISLALAPDQPPPEFLGLQAELRHPKVGLSAGPPSGVQLDAEAGLWVRFPVLPTWKRFDTPEFDFILRSADDLLEGKATVTRKVGFELEPLVISMEPRSAIRGLVVDEAGEPIEGVTVGLQVPGEERVLRDTTNQKGVYELGGIEPGLWTLFVSSPRFEAFERSITLRPGEVAHGDFMLRRKPGGGSVSGEITSRSGQFNGWVFLFLEGTGETPFWRRTDPKLETTPSGRVARFEFEDVPPGEYRLICNTDQPYTFTNRVRVIESPAENLQFVLLDDVEPRKLVVNASSADNGKALEHTLRIIVGGGYADTKQGTVDAPVSVDVAAETTFTWTVSSPGYRPVIGDQADLESDEIRVSLEPGFGAWLHFLDVESLNDIEGVEVFADGVSLGRTNENGELFATWEERPERIHFDENEWLVHQSLTYQSDIDPESGALLSKEGDPSIYAYLRRVR